MNFPRVKLPTCMEALVRRPKFEVKSPQAGRSSRSSQDYVVQHAPCDVGIIKATFDLPETRRGFGFDIGPGWCNELRHFLDAVNDIRLQLKVETKEVSRREVPEKVPLRNGWVPAGQWQELSTAIALASGGLASPAATCNSSDRETDLPKIHSSSVRWQGGGLLHMACSLDLLEGKARGKGRVVCAAI